MSIYSKNNIPTWVINNNTNDPAIPHKRNVVATDVGWVRRQVKGTRVLEEILIPMNSPTFQNNRPATAIEVYVANTTVDVDTTTSFYVVFNEPVAFGAGSGNAAIEIVETANTDNVVFTAVASANNDLVTGAKNTLVFTANLNVAGEFTLVAQNIVNATATAINLVSLNSNSAFNVAVANAVANAVVITVSA